MFANVINGVLIIAGGLLGVLFRKKIKKTYADAVFSGLGLVVVVLGVMNAIRTADVLCMVISMAFGILIGELLQLENRLEKLGQKLEEKAFKGKGGDGSFAQGFVAASLFFCSGSMAITGALEAGIGHEPTILLSKAVIDGIVAITLAAGYGVGVMFGAVSIWIYQGILILFAASLAPYLSAATVLEMSAVGGVLLIAIAVNMLGIGQKLRVANMLPAIFLPLVYLPLVDWIGALF